MLPVFSSSLFNSPRVCLMNDVSLRCTQQVTLVMVSKQHHLVTVVIQQGEAVTGHALLHTHTHTHTMTCRFHNLHHMRGTSISSPYHHGNTSYCITVNSSNLFNRRTSSLCRHTTTRVRACFLTGRRSSGRPDPPL